jgi:hypothetical protein
VIGAGTRERATAVFLIISDNEVIASDFSITTCICMHACATDGVFVPNGFKAGPR